MGRRPAKARLDALADEWVEKIKRTLVRAENLRRDSLGRRPLPETAVGILSSSADNKMRFLNWKAWSLRYGVPVDFVVAELRAVYKKTMKPGLTLGMVPASITSVSARKLVEEAVARTYPNGENERASRAPRQLLPATKLPDFGSKAFLDAYEKSIKERRSRWIAESDAKLDRERNYRRTPEA